jgi:hypothetical protein
LVVVVLLAVVLQASCGHLFGGGAISVQDLESRREVALLPPDSTLVARCGSEATTDLDASYATTIVVRFVSTTPPAAIQEWYTRQLSPLGWSLTSGGFAKAPDEIVLALSPEPGAIDELTFWHRDQPAQLPGGC